MNNDTTNHNPTQLSEQTQRTEKDVIQLLLAGLPPKATARQQAIIAAAFVLFSRKGFAATSTKEIALLGQVAESTIFKHYATKEKLFAAVCDLVFDNVIEPMFKTSLDEFFSRQYDSLEEALSALILNRQAVLQKENLPMPALKMLVQELPYRAELKSRVTRILEGIPLRRLVEDLQSKGQIIDIPADIVVRLLMSSMYGFLITGVVMLPEYFAENPQEYTKQWLQFITRGLTPEGDTI